MGESGLVLFFSTKQSVESHANLRVQSTIKWVFFLVPKPRNKAINFCKITIEVTCSNATTLMGTEVLRF